MKKGLLSVFFLLLMSFSAMAITGEITCEVRGDGIPGGSYEEFYAIYDGDEGFYQWKEMSYRDPGLRRTSLEIDRQFEPMVISAVHKDLSNYGFVITPSSVTMPVIKDTTIVFAAVDTMLPEVRVPYPTGSVNWVLNEMDSVEINFSENTGYIYQFKLYLSIDNGSNYTLFKDTTRNDGMHAVEFLHRHKVPLVPTEVSDQCIIKAEAFDFEGNIGVAYSEVFSVIDTIKPTVTVTSPNGSEEWDMGSVQNITWNADDNISVAARDIYYSDDNGSNWNKLDSTSGNTGTWPWTISCSPSDQYLIKIRVYDQHGNMQEDISDALFNISDTITLDTIKPTISVTAPAEGEVIAQGTTYNITWAANDNRGVVSRKIEFSWGGNSYQLLNEENSNTGSYAWAIDDGNINMDQCKIKISVYDSSGNGNADETSYFQIKDLTPPTVTVSSPKNGQTYKTVCPIQFDAWDTMGVASRSLWYSLDGGKNYTFLDSMIESNPAFYYRSWYVYEFASNDCRIKFRVYDTRGNCNEVISNPFKISDGIAPTITVTEPNDVVEAGTERLIVWHAEDIIGVDYILLELSTDSGASFVRLDSVKPDTCRYLWTVPDGKELPHCFIKATAVDGGGNSAQAVSPEFSISLPTKIITNTVPKEFMVTFIAGRDIVIAMEKPDKVSLSLYTANGKRITDYSKNLSSGKHKCEIAKSNLAHGMYYLFVKRTGKRVIKKIRL